MALNGISTTIIPGDPVATKLARRSAKLALAAAKRSTLNTPGYRTLNTINGTHQSYVDGNLTEVSGTASPTPGRPWSTA